MEEDKKYMTILFKKISLNIERVYEGKQEKASIYPLTLEEMDLIYGRLIIKYNDYIFNHTSLFHIVKKNDNEYSIEMKEEYKKIAKQFL